MFKFKKLLSISLVLTLLFVFSAQTYASGDPSQSGGVYVTTTQAERDAEFDKKMNEILENMEEENSLERGLKYHFKTEYKPYQYKNLYGFAGNQLSGGYNFPEGGGIWYTTSGGPDVSASFSLGLPAPYDFVSVSVNIGTAGGTTGEFVIFPADSHYYKVYVKKTMELRPYVTYRAPAGTEDWEVYNAGAVSIEYSHSAYPLKVS